MKYRTTMACLLAFCEMTLMTAFGAATGGNCQAAATSLSVSTTEKTTAVTLVRGWNQYSGEWSGEMSYDSEYVKWYKVSLTKGEPYIFWTTDTSNENINLSVGPNIDLETYPSTSFDFIAIGKDQYCYVTADGWDAEDPSTCTFYVSLTGGDYVGGKTIMLHYQQAHRYNALPQGIEDYPEALDVSAPGTVVRTTPGNSGEYFFRVTLEGDVEYEFVRLVENASTSFNIEVHAVDESSQSYVYNKMQFSEEDKEGFTIKPDEFGEYIIHLSGDEPIIRLWMGDSEVDVETISIDGVRWSYFVRDEAAVVIGAVPASGILRIPSALGGCPVKGIGRGAFGARVGLTHVMIPDAVEVIEDEAFSGCLALTSIDMPPSVTCIGDGAFAGCSGIKSVTLPACVTRLSDVFPSYQSITNVIICEGTTRISGRAFYGCAALESVSMPKGVASIGYEAFSGCSSLTGVDIPNVTYIGYQAFSGCLSLTGIDIPCVTHIDNPAFTGCDAITSVTIPACVTRLSGVFPSYQSITNVVICEGTTRISDDEFYGCVALESVSMPKGVTSIDSRAFQNCSRLTRIDIPSSMTSIGDEAFSGCLFLTGIDMPPCVTNIGYGAFSGCDAITSVTIPACVTRLCDVFPSYQSITNVVICEGTTRISGYAFYYCSDLESVTLPESVTHIANYAFCGCVSLTNIILPKGITSIDEGAFCHCSSLMSIEIPDGVTCIETSTFSECTHLADVTIPSSVTSIDSEAFFKCASLKNINFAGDAPNMGIDVFYGTPRSLVINVKPNALGWDDYTCMNEMPPWGLRKVNGLATGSGDDPVSSDHEFKLTITNVVVHYLLNSVQPEIAVPVSGDTGFVAVITEVKSSGAVSVPSEWKDNYPTFESMFGTDFGKALMSQTGKKDSANNDMLVWQDFVAGTDPTKKDDVFTASITLVDGVPNISYTPELSDEQKALRTYKTFAKKQLQDEEWIDITNLDGVSKKSYNFFKVTVEMK